MDTDELDYVAVIKKLSYQAKMAKAISVVMIYSLISIICFLFYNAYAMNNKSTHNVLNDYLSNSIASYLNVDGENKTSSEVAIKAQANGDSKNSQSKENIDETLNKFTEAMNSAAASAKILGSTSKTRAIAESIPSIILTITIVVMGIYAIKIALIFIRYYSHLSTKYDSQVISFLAGRGDMDKTIKLLDALSINDIKMGDTPDSIYEQAFKTLSKSLVAKK